MRARSRRCVARHTGAPASRRAPLLRLRRRRTRGARRHGGRHAADTGTEIDLLRGGRHRQSPHACEVAQHAAAVPGTRAAAGDVVERPWGERSFMWPTHGATSCASSRRARCTA